MASGLARRDAIINYSNLVEDAKVTAVELLGQTAPDAVSIFYETKLEDIEKGIRNLNEYSSKCWLASAITLFTIVYDNQLYRDSGLTWEQYLSDARHRLGMDERDVCEQLSSARFFIRNHKALKKAGWNPIGSGRKLARAELATDLCGDSQLVVDHIAKDTWTEFKNWYSSYKIAKKEIPAPKRDLSKLVDYTKGSLTIDGNDAITVSRNIEDADRIKLEGYIKKIAESLKQGYEPAIIPVYDNKEATVLLHLRDKNRQQH